MRPRFWSSLVLALLAGCEAQEQPITACDQVEQPAADMPLHTFIALHTDRPCDYAGTCQYGEPQIVCDESRDDLRNIECRCMDGLFKCFDNAPEVMALNEACEG